MAADSEPKTDLGAHVRSYGRFAAMMKWGTIISFILTALVVIIIAT